MLLLPLIAMLFGAMMVTVGTATPPPAKLYVDPPIVDGQPPMNFRISIMVETVNDLYAAGFTLQYAPYASVVVVSDVQEGDFLGQGGNTAFAVRINPFAGTVKVGMTLLGEVPGVSGAGELASMKVTVIEAGDSPLDLNDDYLVDSGNNPIYHNTWNGEYTGPTLNLVRAQILPGRLVTPGMTMSFASKVRNNDDHKTLTARVRWDMIRDDGMRVSLYAGQAFVTTPRVAEYIYVDSYSPVVEWPTWTNIGASVFGAPDGNYTESLTNGAMTSEYGFQDITLNPGDVIGRVTLEGYTQYPNGPTDAIDIDMYCINPSMFAWFGSLYGTSSWGWHGVRWTTDAVSDVVPSVLGSDASGLNSLTMGIYNYEGDAANPIRVDSLRLLVEFSQLDPVAPPEYEIAPGGSVELDPVMWALAPEDVGKYIVTANAEYTYMGSKWIPANKVQTRAFKVVLP